MNPLLCTGPGGPNEIFLGHAIRAGHQGIVVTSNDIDQINWKYVLEICGMENLKQKAARKLLKKEELAIGESEFRESMKLFPCPQNGLIRTPVPPRYLEIFHQVKMARILYVVSYFTDSATTIPRPELLNLMSKSKKVVMLDPMCSVAVSIFLRKCTKLITQTSNLPLYLANIKNKKWYRAIMYVEPGAFGYEWREIDGAPLCPVGEYTGLVTRDGLNDNASKMIEALYANK